MSAGDYNDQQRRTRNKDLRLAQFQDTYFVLSYARHMKNFLKNNAIAILALFLVLGGTATAAYQVGKNSVGTAQIKNKAVTEQKLAKSVQTKLNKKAARGPQGERGPQGDRGVQGSAANVTVYTSSNSRVGNGTIAINCENQSIPISHYVETFEGTADYLDYGSSGDGWSIDVYNASGPDTSTTLHLTCLATS